MVAVGDSPKGYLFDTSRYGEYKKIQAFTSKNDEPFNEMQPPMQLFLAPGMRRLISLPLPVKTATHVFGISETWTKFWLDFQPLRYKFAGFYLHQGQGKGGM